MTDRKAALAKGSVSGREAPQDKANVRNLALEVLLAVTRDGAYSHVALKAVLDKYQYLSKQERSFLTRLSEGTLERMLWIDYVLDRFSSVSVRKMKPVIRTILRMGVYELQYMDAVPPSATINEAVKLTEKKGFHNLKGFVNGVLRSISRGISSVKLPDREKEPAAYLSVAYSMPEWIVEEWLGCYEVQTVEEMLAAFLAETPTSIRVNTANTDREALAERLRQEGVTVEENPELPCGLYISGYDHLSALNTFREGMFYVQDTSSMLVSELASPKPGDLVLDVCAAPGGKSLHMAELLGGTGLVEARDLTPAKVELIRENIARCRLTNIRALQADAREFYPADEGRADIVLADVPCSGLGTLGKKTDIKYRVTRESIEELAALQREILSTVSRYVKPGGTLMYSTCTVSRRENEDNVAWFLAGHPEFTLAMQRQLLPAAGRRDGFFLAKLIKENHG